MQKILLVASVLAATLAAPAAAQSYGYQPPHGYDDRDGDRRDWDRRDWRDDRRSHERARDMAMRIDHLRRQIAFQASRRMISPREAASLDRQAVGLRQRLDWAVRTGFDRRERDELRWRLEHLTQRLRWERRDDDGRPDRWRDWR